MNVDGSRVLTFQDVANSFNHEGQLNAAQIQSELMYQWLVFLGKFERLKNIRFPLAEEFTLRYRCLQENAEFLTKNFEICEPEIPHYHTLEGDLLGFLDVDMIAHVSDCCSLYNCALSDQIAVKLNCNACSGRKPDSSIPGYASVATRSVPGTIRVEKSTVREVYVAHLYSLYAYGQEGKEEPYHDRLENFSLCLAKLANSMREKKLTTVAIPFGMGNCLMNGDWQRCQQIIDAWSRDNLEDFKVFVILRSDDKTPK
jgi:hypothetical protein